MSTGALFHNTKLQHIPSPSMPATTAGISETSFCHLSDLAYATSATEHESERKQRLCRRRRRPLSTIDYRKSAYGRAGGSQQTPGGPIMYANPTSIFEVGLTSFVQTGPLSTIHYPLSTIHHRREGGSGRGRRPLLPGPKIDNVQIVQNRSIMYACTFTKLTFGS